MTTSRRSFFKCLVGAFVASAIELNMTTHHEIRAPKFDPMDYVGEFQWINLPPSA